MTLNEYNRFCRSLPATTSVVQWGGAHVWKVGSKVFAIARQNEDDAELHVTFKCSPMSYDMLSEMPGCRPAPYLASRGMKWIQRTSALSLTTADLKNYLRASYDLVAAGLPRRTQQELGLAQTAGDLKTKPPGRPRSAAARAAATASPTAKSAKSGTTAKSEPKASASPRTRRAPKRKGAAQ